MTGSLTCHHHHFSHLLYRFERLLSMKAQLRRGYLGVFGPEIDEIAREFTIMLTESYGDQKLQLKHAEYHITIASKPELQALRTTGALSSDEPTTIPGLVQLNNDLQRQSSTPIVYGLGTNRKGAYWVTVAWAAGQRFRSQLTLSPKQFHITLTSVDEHGIDKVSIVAHSNLYRFTSLIPTGAKQRNPGSPLVLFC